MENSVGSLNRHREASTKLASCCAQWPISGAIRLTSSRMLALRSAILIPTNMSIRSRLYFRSLSMSRQNMELEEYGPLEMCTKREGGPHGQCFGLNERINFR